MADFARGQRLKELRDRTHQSQENVAYELGVSTKSLRAWEHGGKVRWPNAKKLGAFYGVDPETLVSRETPEPEEDMPLPEGQSNQSQLDRIEHMLSDIHAILTGEARAKAPELAGLASRLLSADESPRPKAAGRPKTPRAARKRTVA